ncbi:MAG: hypothetical protein ACYDBB_27045 [Armatimonadota bacterium]
MAGSTYIETMAQAVAQATATSGVVVPANEERKYLLIVNLSDVTVYVNLNGDTAESATGLPLDPDGGGFIELTYGYGNLTKTAVTGVHGGTGEKALLVVEGV